MSTIIRWITADQASSLSQECKILAEQMIFWRLLTDKKNIFSQICFSNFITFFIYNAFSICLL